MGDDTLGEILMQKGKKSAFMQPIHFERRIITQVEKGYSFSEKMVLALIFVVTMSMSYLLPKSLSF